MKKIINQYVVLVRFNYGEYLSVILETEDGRLYTPSNEQGTALVEIDGEDYEIVS